MPKVAQKHKTSFSKPISYSYYPQLGVWLEANFGHWWLANAHADFIGSKQAIPANWFPANQAKVKTNQILIKLPNLQDVRPNRLLGGNLRRLPATSWRQLLRTHSGWVRPTSVYGDQQQLDWTYGSNSKRLSAHLDLKLSLINIRSGVFSAQPTIWQTPRPSLSVWQADWLAWYANSLLTDQLDNDGVVKLIRLVELVQAHLSTNFLDRAHLALAARFSADWQPKLETPAASLLSTVVKEQSLAAARSAWWLAHCQLTLAVLFGLNYARSADIKLYRPAAKVLINQLLQKQPLTMGLRLEWFNNFISLDPRFLGCPALPQAKITLLRVWKLINQHAAGLEIKTAELAKIDIDRIGFGLYTQSAQIASPSQYVQATRLTI